jgi:hypothetical protein
MKYIYETINIGYSQWTGKTKDDYFDIINERGQKGWRFVCFSPKEVKSKEVNGIELIFEKKIEND